MPSPMDAYQPKNNLKDLQATIIEEIDELSTTALRLSRNKQLVSFVEETFHKKRKQKQKKARLLALSGIGLWFVAIVVFAVSIMPQVAYGLFPDATERVAAAIGATVDVEKSGFGDTLYKLDVEAKPQYVPPFDPSLPKKNTLIIPEIGLETTIEEGEDWEEVLVKGVWRAPDFGNLENRELPMILAAHRFGYIYWSNDFRRKSSFYNLPKLENGDRVEVVWNQRKYLFEIFEGYTDSKIKDLDADLILFTCQVLNSDRRIIRKARLITPEGFGDISGK